MSKCTELPVCCGRVMMGVVRNEQGQPVWWCPECRRQVPRRLVENVLGEVTQ